MYHLFLPGVYLTMTMAITTLAMIATVLVLNLYSMEEKPVPYWAKKLFIVYLARIMCMCSCVVPGEPPDHTPHPRRRRKQSMATQPAITYCENEERINLVRLSPDHSDRNSQSDGGTTKVRERRASTPGPLPTQWIPPPRQGSQSAGKKGKMDYSKDWVHVAAVFDRLFFWLCFLLTAVTTLLLFHPLTTSKYFKIPVIEKST